VTDPWLDKLWETFGGQLQTIEFGKHVRFLLNDFISPCLQSCQRLNELNYFIFFAAVPSLQIPHAAISTVGLHAFINDMLHDGGRTLFEHLKQHFDVLMDRNSLPSLLMIRLYGDWEALLSYPDLTPTWQSLRESHITVEICDN